jgi:hypothetical protein
MNIFISYDYRKTNSIEMLGYFSIYRCTIGVFLGYYFREKFANNCAVCGVFTMIDKLCINSR